MHVNTTSIRYLSFSFSLSLSLSLSPLNLTVTVVIPTMFLHPLVLAPVGLGLFSRLDCSKNFMRHGIQLQALNGTYTGRRERQRNTQPLF